MVISDIKFYFRKAGFTFFLNPGFQAIILYRLGHWAFFYNRYLNPFWYFYSILVRVHSLFHKIELPPRAKIGKNLFLPHPYGLVMGSNTIVGDNCTIGPWVVIGHLKKDGNPTIGNNVYIGPHSCVLGKINIGNNTIIGANCLVINNTPPGSKILGVLSNIKLDEHSL